MLKILLGLLSLSSGSGQNYIGPNNSAVIMNNLTNLECRDVNKSSDSGVKWKLYPVDTKTDRTIYMDFQLVNKPDHYHVNHSREQGQYDLIINHTIREDAGVYACLVAGKDYRAQLIVLASDPICETSGWDETNHFARKNSVKLWCQVTVWGNWFPRMQWRIKNGYSHAVECNETVVNGTIVSVLTISVESIVTNDRFIQFVCETFFSPKNHSYKIQGPRLASNVPEYRYTWTSPELVLHPERTTVGRNDLDDETTVNFITVSTESITFEMIRSDGTPQEFPQIMAVTLFSVISISMVVVCVVIIMFKCFRGNGHNTNHRRTKMKNDNEIPIKYHPAYTSLALEMESSEKVEELECNFQRGTSEYYSQIDESQMRELLARHSDKVVRPGSYLELDYNQMRNDPTEERINVNYEHCTTSGPIQVHTFEGKKSTSNQEGKSDGRNPEKIICPGSYLELDSNQMLDDATEEEDITKYEPCIASDPKPVHLYERKMDVVDPEEESGDLEAKKTTLSGYDQLKSIDKSKPPKPSVYKRLQLKVQIEQAGQLNSH